MCDAIASITQDFSFAYLKEAFVATLLELARNNDDDDDDDDENYDHDEDEEEDPLDKYNFWRVFKEQVKVLRDDMGSGNEEDDGSEPPHRPIEHRDVGERFRAARDGMLPLIENMRLQGDPQQQSAKAVFLSQDAAPSTGFRQESSPAVHSPMRSFAPLAKNKQVAE